MQCRRRCGPDQLVQPGWVPGPAVPGKPGQVRCRWRFRRDGAGRVDKPGKERVVVGIDGYQSLAGQHGGDRGLPGARTACDLDSAHHAHRRPASMTGANEFVRSRTRAGGGRAAVCRPDRSKGEMPVADCCWPSWAPGTGYSSSSPPTRQAWYRHRTDRTKPTGAAGRADAIRRRPRNRAVPGVDLGYVLSSQDRRGTGDIRAPGG